MLVAPPYTCAKTLHHGTLHAQWQYDAGCTDPKALTLEPRDPSGCSARGTQVRSGKLKQEGTVKTYG